jgi:hypothetical protein
MNWNNLCLPEQVAIIFGVFVIVAFILAMLIDVIKGGD